MNGLISKDAEVTFGDDYHFNFKEEVSIKTTRFADDDNAKSPSTPSTNNSTGSSPSSILKSNSSRSVASEITTDSHLNDLETGMGSLTGKLDQIFAKIMGSPPDSPSSSTGAGEDNI